MFCSTSLRNDAPPTTPKPYTAREMDSHARLSAAWMAQQIAERDLYHGYIADDVALAAERELNDARDEVFAARREIGR